MNLTFLRQFYKFAVFSIIIVLIGISINGVVFGKELKIGFVDMERLHAEIPFYQELEDVLKAKDVELERFRGDLYKEYIQFYQVREQKYNWEKLDKLSGQDDVTERFQSDLKIKMNGLNNRLEQKKQEIDNFKTEQSQALTTKIDKLINDYSKHKKLAMVIDKKLVLYGGTDITNDIIKKVDKELKKNKTSQIKE